MEVISRVDTAGSTQSGHGLQVLEAGGSSAMKRGKDADIIVSNWDELMKALEVETALAVEDALEPYCYFGDVSVEKESNDEELIVSVGASSFCLYYPFPLPLLFQYIDEADWEHKARSEWEQLEEDIYDVERFKIQVDRWPADDNYEALPDTQSYPYKRAAPGTWTVARWLGTRIRPVYPGYDVTVLKPGLSPAHGRTQLRSLRRAWAL